jgi:hypothetical protein
LASSAALVRILLGSSADRTAGVMLAAIDIHKAVLQAAVLDPESAVDTEERLKSSWDALVLWAKTGMSGQLRWKPQPGGGGGRASRSR